MHANPELLSGVSIAAIVAAQRTPDSFDQVWLYPRAPNRATVGVFCARGARCNTFTVNGRRALVVSDGRTIPMED